MRLIVTLLVVLWSLAPGVAAPRPAPAFTLSIDDPTGVADGYRSQIDSHVDAALGSWLSYLRGSAEFDILVRITPDVARAEGRSATSGLVGFVGGRWVFEQGMAYEIRTGVDPNGHWPDIEFLFNPLYLTEELWFDPDPWRRTAPVGEDRIDAMSVFLHEFGHALAFNGWGDAVTGAVPSWYASPWDVLTRFDGSTLSFVGRRAVRAYGAPVPVTFGNNFHLGNAAGPGADLVGDLMNGLSFAAETRYRVSPLNVAMLADMGVAVVPEPSSRALMLWAAAWLLVLAAWRRRCIASRNFRSLAVRRAPAQPKKRPGGNECPGLHPRARPRATPAACVQRC
jgi:hypothetical protein